MPTTKSTNPHPIDGRLSGEAPAADVVPQLRALAAFTERARLTFTPEGIHVIARNNANTRLVDTTIPLDYTTRHHSVTVGVETDDLLDGATFPDRYGDDTVSFTLQSSDPELITVSGNLMDYTDLVALDEMYGEPTFPEFDYTTETTLSATNFKTTVAAVAGGGGHSDAIRLSASPGTDTSTAEGQRVDTADYAFTWDAKADVDGEYASTAIAQGVLLDLCGCLPPSATVTLRMRDDYPLTVETDHVTLVMAPAVESGK